MLRPKKVNKKKPVAKKIKATKRDLKKPIKGGKKKKY